MHALRQHAFPPESRIPKILQRLAQAQPEDELKIIST